MSDVAIHVEGLSKLYRIGATQRYSTLRDTLVAGMRAPLAWTRRNGHERSNAPAIWALQDVSLELKQGEVLGVVGSNGAGKSTLLKVLSRVTEPTRGRVTMRGRMGSMLEVGTGFHPELTGRENAYLNGAILGMSRREVDRKFGEIAAFAEIDEFLDTPVKRYSSGMYVRLAFAVAAHLEPDILLVDEVLAVGDSAFQSKCYRRIRDFAEGGCTVIIVSHNLSALQGMCQRVAWLESGHLRLDGDPGEVIAAYLETQEQRYLRSRENTGPANVGPLAIRRVVLRDGSGRETTEFRSGDDIVVELHYSARELVKAPFFSVAVSDPASGLLFQGTMLINGHGRRDISGDGIAACRFDRVPLMPKAYQIWGSVRDEQAVGALVRWQPLAAFRVISLPADLKRGGAYQSVSHLKTDAPIYVPHEWSYKHESGADAVASDVGQCGPPSVVSRTAVQCTCGRRDCRK